MNLGLNMSTKDIEQLVAHGEKALNAFEFGIMSDISNMLGVAIFLWLVAGALVFGLKKYMQHKGIEDTMTLQSKLVACIMIIMIGLGSGVVVSEFYVDRNYAIGRNNCPLVSEAFTVDPKDVDVAFKNSGYDKDLIRRFKQVTIDYKSKCVDTLGIERPRY